MSRYLNFYEMPWIRDNEREVKHVVRLLESDCAEFPTDTWDHCIDPIAIFETSTTPPTLVKSHRAFGNVVGKHPKFPDFHIDPFGNICSSKDHSIVMAGTPMP